MAALTGSATEPAETLTVPTVGADTDTWGGILNDTSIQALLNYALWLKLRVPLVAPTAEADGRLLEVQEGALVFADAPSSGATTISDLTDVDTTGASNGDRLTYNEGVWEPAAPSAGDGDVVGPASAVDERVAVFDGTTGKLLKDGGAAVADLATAAQGALADTAVQPAAIEDFATATGFENMVALTQSAYDALDPPDAGTLYFITDV